MSSDGLWDYGFTVRASHVPLSRAIHTFLNLTPRVEITFTESDWCAWRDDMEREGFVLHEVARRPHHAEEPVR